MAFKATTYQPYDFANRRHIGPSPEEMTEMLAALGAGVACVDLLLSPRTERDALHSEHGLAEAIAGPARRPCAPARAAEAVPRGPPPSGPLAPRKARAIPPRTSRPRQTGDGSAAREEGVISKR